ncbi:uncharacterized protein [Populus alba]|uniref:uncharacterized protein n=1 Tax=Populus alba TaxID=43335 RepID=UPI003CC70ECD
MEHEQSSKKGKNNAFDPFSLYHSNHPGLVLVSKPHNDDNYSTWCRSMMISLNVKNKLGFIDGTVQIPSVKSQPVDYTSWKRCNDMILSWILNSISPELTDSVIYSTTAQEVWEDLRDRFSHSNTPRIFQIERDIACTSQVQMTIAAYYTKLKGLWDELGFYSSIVCSCGADHKRRQLMQFLMELNDSYKAIRGQILLLNPLLDVFQAYSSIIQEEKQHSLNDTWEIAKTTAMAVQRDALTALALRLGQITSFRSNSFNRKPLHFSYYAHDHHVRDTYWKLHGYPPGHPKHKAIRPPYNKSAHPSANYVKEGPSRQKMLSVMNGFSDLQFQHILSIMNNNGIDQSHQPQANVVVTSPECVLTAMHLINNLPTPLLSHQTPFERLYGKVPTYSHLKIFGCLAYATEVHAAHKFAPRAIRCVFLGYPVSQKAYKLYNLTTHKFFTSHDVVFHEHIFPYKSSPPIPAPHASTPNSATPSPVLPLSIPDAPVADYPIFNPTSPTSVPPNFSPPVPHLLL